MIAIFVFTGLIALFCFLCLGGWLVERFNRPESVGGEGWDKDEAAAFVAMEAFRTGKPVVAELTEDGKLFVEVVACQDQTAIVTKEEN